MSKNLESKRRSETRRRRRHKVLGLCAICSERAVLGYSRCARHLRYAAASSEKRRAECRRLGLCYSCGQRKSEEDMPFRLCGECQRKADQRQAARRKKAKR